MLGLRLKDLNQYMLLGGLLGDNNENKMWV